MAISPGWIVKPPIADPEAGAVDRRAEAGHEREQQRDHAEQQERVLVAARAYRTLRTRNEREHERGDADRDPHRLGRRDADRVALRVAVRVRSRRVSITKPMPSSRLTSGQQRRVGAGRESRTARCAHAEQRDEHARRSASSPGGIAGAFESPSST